MQKLLGRFSDFLEFEYHNIDLCYFLCFAAGILCYFSGYIDISYFSASAGILLILLILLKYRKNICIYFFACCTIAFFLGVFVSDYKLSSITTKPIDKITNAVIEAKVKSLKPTLRGMQLTLVDISPHYSENLQVKKVRISMAHNQAANIKKNDLVKMKVKLFPLSRSVLPGTFDFGFYLKMSEIEATGFAIGDVEILSENSNRIKGAIDHARSLIYKRLLKHCEKDVGNFLAAILIGETRAIPKQVANNMRDTGASHILSVSGLHLSLVSMIFFVSSRFLLNFSNYIAYNYNIKIMSAIISISGSFLYLQISGGNIAASRAFIMVTIFIASIILGRNVHLMRSVMLAAFCILSVMPEYIYHPSFQLSFMAVFCLVSMCQLFTSDYALFPQIGDGYFAKIKFYLLGNIYSSLAASLITAPYVIYHFYKFANYSLLMNLIAVPIMSFVIMPLALLALILMPVSFESIILYILNIFVKIIINSADYIAHLPKSVLYIGYIPDISLLLFTLGFFWVVIWKSRIRTVGILLILVSIFFIFNKKNANFIYDHELKIVAMQNKNNELEIYSDKAPSKFISDYLVNWYGQKETIVKHKKIAYKNRFFKLNDGRKISLSYKKCSKMADIVIITSKKLQCIPKKHQKIINNQYLWQNKQVIIY